MDETTDFGAQYDILQFGTDLAAGDETIHRRVLTSRHLILCLATRIIVDGLRIDIAASSPRYL